MVRELARILIPVLDRNGLESMISDHFSRSPYYALVELDEDYNVENVEFIGNPRAMGYRPGEYFAGLNIDYIVITGSGIVLGL